MNKKLMIVAVLSLLLCLAMSACGNHITGRDNPAETTEWTPDTTVPAGQGTESPDSTGDTTEPTVESDVSVGSGRAEGAGSGNQPEGTTPPATKPNDSEASVDAGLSLTYPQYMALSGKQQQELYDKYFSDDPLAFAEWFKKIKQEYDDETPEIIATGPIDIGDYINP